MNFYKNKKSSVNLYKFYFVLKVFYYIKHFFSLYFLNKQKFCFYKIINLKKIVKSCINNLWDCTQYRFYQWFIKFIELFLFILLSNRLIWRHKKMVKFPKKRPSTKWLILCFVFSLWKYLKKKTCFSYENLAQSYWNYLYFLYFRFLSADISSQVFISFKKTRKKIQPTVYSQITKKTR